MPETDPMHGEGGINACDAVIGAVVLGRLALALVVAAGVVRGGGSEDCGFSGPIAGVEAAGRAGL